MQNMQRDAQPKTISSGAGVEVESGPDSEHVSLSQSSATGLPVVAEVQQSSELAFSVAEVPVGNPQTSVSLTSSGTQSHTDSLRMWVGQTSMSDGVPLVGFEFMKDSASSTTSGTVQGVSPERCRSSTRRARLTSRRSGKKSRSGIAVDQDCKRRFSTDRPAPASGQFYKFKCDIAPE